MDFILLGEKKHKALVWEAAHPVRPAGAFVELLEAVDLFLEEGELNTGTVRAYRRYLLRFLNFIGNVSVESITQLQITHFRAFTSKTSSKISVYKQLSTLRSFFTFLEENGLNVQVHKIKLGHAEYDHFKASRPEDIELALKHSSIKYKAIICLIATTGLRVQEVCNIHADNIDFINNEIKVLGKNGKYRKVYICPKLKKLLLNFPDGFNVVPNSIRAYLQRLRIELNIPTLHPHSIRKMYATEMFRRGGNALKVSHLLGHTDIKTTMDYICLDEIEMRDYHTKYIEDNHEIYFCKKKGGTIQLELKGWCRTGKTKQVERAINKAITDILT